MNLNINNVNDYFQLPYLRNYLIYFAFYFQNNTKKLSIKNTHTRENIK